MKEIKALIKELRKTPRGKGVLFFAFYFIVFGILFIIFQIRGNNTYHVKEYEPGRSYSLNTSAIEDNNYHFKYIINKDNTKYIYEGDKYNEVELFTFNNKKYYYDGNKYYSESNNWKEVNNPYIYSKFLDIKNILLLIKNATLDSKTDYQSGNTKYNFLISSNTINEIIDNKVTDIDEIPNSIMVNNNEDTITDNFIYHLNSYCLNNKSCNNDLEINLSYENFGKIKMIKSPLIN